MKNKREFGQYFTTSNPFSHYAFLEWYESIPDKEKNIIIEPFSGSNNIIKMIKEVGINSKWLAYDIDPPETNNLPEVKVIKRDTLKNFPKRGNLSITNPPYLAKNSATMRGLDFPKDSIYNDLYKLSLDVMLKNNDYVAAIIPESFINQNLFHKRLKSVISLNTSMFDDTDHPVCLAMFSKEEDNDDFLIYNYDRFIGKYEDLKKHKIEKQSVEHPLKFNDPEGNLSVVSVDSTKSPSCRFGGINMVDSSRIKESSRAFTKISGIPANIDIDLLVNNLNKSLNEYREITSDVFMTPFKGLRSDGMYRRRLDFKTIRNIINKEINNINNKQSKQQKSKIID